MRENSVIAAMLAQIPAQHHATIGEEVAAAAGAGDADGEVELTSESLLASGIK